MEKEQEINNEVPAITEGTANGKPASGTGGATAGEPVPQSLENDVRRLVEKLVEECLDDKRVEAYRKGLNERIDNLLHDLPEASGDEGDDNPMPRYCHRSIWDF